MTTYRWHLSLSPYERIVISARLDNRSQEIDMTQAGGPFRMGGQPRNRSVTQVKFLSVTGMGHYRQAGAPRGKPHGGSHLVTFLLFTIRLLIRLLNLRILPLFLFRSSNVRNIHKICNQLFRDIRYLNFLFFK